MAANPLDLTYPKILEAFSRYLVPARTESRAFVAWFLEHYYRLEVDECQDAICDGPDDKGVDGIYLDSTFERIDVLQAKLFQNSRKTLGDVLLKEFVGTLSQFRSKKTIAELEKTTTNQDLQALIKDLELRDKVAKGWKVRGVFVTNCAKDRNAEIYLRSHATITVWDRDRLTKSYLDTSPPSPQHAPVKFDVSGFEVVHYKTAKAEAYIAPVKATNLLKLNGLKNGSLFAWNVRHSLGRTKVNKEIAESILNPKEHKNFLLYHNGITILCQDITYAKDTLTIDRYNVVNGCQSLTTLSEHERDVSDELRLIVRLVKLKPDDQLAADITRRSNNQNSISARDLQSNSILQRRLQLEINRASNRKVFYEIKRGETGPQGSESFPNDEAARVLLAFDLEEPWSCHQSYKLFDDLHARIFGRPEVNAERVLALRSAYRAVVASMGKISEEMIAGYRLSRYFVLYLLRKVLEMDKLGIEFCTEPGAFYKVRNGGVRLEGCLGVILKDLMVDLNAELKERADKGKPFDYKRELKSPNAVRTFSMGILPMYEKALQRGRVDSFAKEWRNSRSGRSKAKR